MNKIYLVIGVALILITFIGYYYKIGYLDEKGWENNTEYPFWNISIIWGLLFCGLLYFKKLMPFQHPIMWLMGGLPLVYGLYVAYMMGVF